MKLLVWSFVVLGGLVPLLGCSEPASRTSRLDWRGNDPASIHVRRVGRLWKADP